MKLSPQMREQIWGAYDWAERARRLEDEFTRIVAPFQRSAFLYELGQLHEYMTPDRERALWPYGRAWTATGSHTPALERARSIYRELGRLEMVAELALVEFKQTTEPDFLALAGEALLDARLPERAVKPLRTALQFRPHDVVLRDAILVAELDESDASAEIARLESEIASADAATSARLRLRIARILWQFRPSDPRCAAALMCAYASDPEDERVHALARAYFENKKQVANLYELCEREAGLAGTIDERVECYRRGGTILSVRFRATIQGARLLGKALSIAHQHSVPEVPGHLAMLTVLRDAHAERGDLGEVMSLCEQALTGPRTPDEQLSLALFAALTAWKYLGDIGEARRYFDQVQAIMPDHPRAVEFAQFGSALSATGRPHAEHVDRAERVVRYSLPVGVRHIDDEQIAFWGYTRDFNEAGVYVVTGRTLPQDEWVVLRLRVPCGSGWELGDHEVEALIVRVEPGIGFAAQIVDSDEGFAAAINRLKSGD